MAFIHSPQIVTNGLVVYTDAANTKSLVSGSSTWRDLSGNGKNGGAGAGATWGSQNGGVVNFNGVSSYVSFGTGNTFFPLTNLTIDLWFQSKGTVATTGTVPGLFGFTYGVRTYFGTANSISFSVSTGSTSQFLTYTHPSNFRDDGLWYNIAFQATPTNTYMYLNGELKTSRSVTWLGNTIWPADTWNLARDNNNAYQYFTGSMASYKMYNRALSAQEVLQNYNATKGRFGL